jgi:hypothetical protein
MSEIPAPKVVKLRTGAEVPAPVVEVTIDALIWLMDTNPIALYEAVEIARDKTHVPFGNTGAVLEKIGLLVHGVMHGAKRAVILAAVEGHDELGLTRQDLQALRTSLKAGEDS